MGSSALRKVLVTGGMGFIGQFVVAKLREKGYCPVIFDHHFVPREPPVERVMGSVTDKDAVDHAVSLCDAVIHLAGILGTQETINYPDFAFEVNVMGSLNVFQAVRRYELPAVYITCGNYWMNNPYSISKHTAERIALMMNCECGTKIAVVRGYNAYGPGQRAAPIRKIIPNFILSALRDETITVYGDGEQLMDMIYVEDLADILVRVLDAPQYDTPYEAGTGRRTTVNEIATVVIGLVGAGSIEHVPMRPGEPEHAVVMANPETLGDMRPAHFVTLRTGIARTIPYYRGYL